MKQTNNKKRGHLMQKRGESLLVIGILLFLLSLLISFSPDSNMKHTITGLQTGLGCCVSADTCSPSDEASCDATFFSQVCEEVTQCQPGCCQCITNTGQTVQVHSDVLQTQCSTQDPGLCFGIANIDKANFYGGMPAIECTIDNFAPGSIAGRITNKDTSANLDSATITTTPWNIQATSDSNGTYLLQDVPAGEIELTTSKNNFYNNKSNVTLTSGQDITDYNIALKEIPITTGSISGRVSVSGAGATADGISIILEPTYQTTTTDSNGDYNFIGIGFNTYDIVAQKQDYSQDKQTTIINASNPSQTVNLAIQKLQLGTLNGQVTNSGGTPITNVQIYVDGSLKDLTDINGYSTQIETGPHQVTAKANGFREEFAEIVISQGTNIQDFTLTTINTNCANPNKPSPSQVTANHILGIKGIDISWSSACEDIAGYLLTRTDGLKNKYFPTLNNQQVLSYTDSDVDWGQPYTYIIKAIYNDQVVRNSTGTMSNTLTMGNSECKDQYNYPLNKFNEFCLNDYERKTCNNQNEILDALQRGTDPVIPPDCSTLNSQQYSNYLCSGPDSEGLTYCKDQGACNVVSQGADPFGLYFDKYDCYGAQNSPNYCYYDYSDTLADICYECEQTMTCFDYISNEPACVDDNCQISGLQDCGFFDTAYSELGKGICYEQNYTGKDQCSRCDSNNALFSNTGCSQDLCDVLGSCYADADESKCLACFDCESLTTEQQCTGGQDFTINGCSYSYSLSQDSCAMGVCSWDGNSCYKDGNDKDGADCLLADSECRQDFSPPVTELEPSVSKVTIINGLTFISDLDTFGGFLHYCIDIDNTCCPDQVKPYTDLSQKGRIELTSNDLQTAYPQMFDGNYYVRFYSEDIHKNQELIKSGTFSADLKAPEITITPIIQKGDCNSISTLIFNISVDDFATCTDNLEQTRGPDVGTSKSSLNSNYGTAWQTSYPSEDGAYKYMVTCIDNAGNSNSEEKFLELDACWIINMIAPDKAIQELNPNFDITTTNPSSCDFYVAEVFQNAFATSDGISHTNSLGYNLVINTSYSDFNARCTNLVNQSQVDTEYFSFTTDYSPPLTEFRFISNSDRITNGTDWQFWFNDRATGTMSFTCYDAHSSMDHEYGCDNYKFKFCQTENIEGICTPQTSEMNISLDTDKSTKVCYYSQDLAPNSNIEIKKCGILNVGDGTGINLVNPLYGVSNIPIFDVEIKSQIPSQLCKYQANGFPNTFISQQNPVNYFTPMNTPPTQDHWLDNFAEVNSSFDMYIKCQDMNGFVNEDNPANYLLEYDPSIPLIQSAVASPAEVLEGNTVDFIVRTDDKTVCRYSNFTTDYNSMFGAGSGAFDGWDTFGNLLFRDGSEPDFKTENRATLTLPASSQRTTYTYHVVCQNRAGNVSQYSDITFVVDYNVFGAITSTLPSGSVSQTTVNLEVNTSKSSNCQYTEDSFPYSFTQTGSTYHTSQKTGLTEQSYTYPVTCNFFSPAVTRNGQISFQVDLTNPEITSIEDGNVSCGDSISPQFTVTDFSQVAINYSLWLENGSNDVKVGDWTLGALGNLRPSINIPDIEYNETYFVKGKPIDAAGNKGSEKISNGVKALPQSSGVCINDNSPPVIRVIRNETCTELKITLSCTDETRCETIYYDKVPPEGNCNPTKTWSGSPVSVSQPSKVCWTVSDPNGNSVNSSQTVTTSDSDNDGVFDDCDECGSTAASDRPVDTEGCGPSERDTDGDGLHDSWEKRFQICGMDYQNPEDGRICGSDTSDPVCDRDGDKTTNWDEYPDQDPCEGPLDSDGDGMPDAWESQNGLNPNNPGDAVLDPDNDGLTNLQEYKRGTDPNNPDSDGDGILDGGERTSGTDPNDSNDTPSDNDNDQIDDNWENEHCGGDCDPNGDDDGDGVTNFVEYNWNLNPNNSDSDGDGIPDGWEIKQGTDPGINDANEDYDGDEANNYQEYQAGTDPQNDDSDNDGMADGWEIRQGLNPLEDDADEDPDGDRLTNLEEYEYYIETERYISVFDADTDKDGWSDSEEITQGYNPIDTNSHPESKVAALSFIIIGLLLLLIGTGYIIYMETVTPKKEKTPPKLPPRKPLLRPRIPRISREQQRRRMQAMELRRKRRETLAKKRSAKESKRSKFFEAFGSAKGLKKKELESKKGKLLEKQQLEKISKTVNRPEGKTEFDKLAKLTEEHLKGEGSIDSLLKLSKVPKSKKDEFEKLTNLVGSKMNLRKGSRSKELTPIQKQKVLDVFYELSTMNKESKLSKKQKTNLKKEIKEKVKTVKFTSRKPRKIKAPVKIARRYKGPKKATRKPAKKSSKKLTKRKTKQKPDFSKNTFKKLDKLTHNKASKKSFGKLKKRITKEKKPNKK